MSKLTIEINDEIMREAEEIVEGIGLDVETAVKMFFRRLINDQSIAFVLANATDTKARKPLESAPPVAVLEEKREKRGGMRKSLAMKLFKENGCTVSSNVSYSSRNSATGNYWNNFRFSMLSEDWILILNNQDSRTLFLFQIPAGAIRESELIPSMDQPDLVDLQIRGDDPLFEDKKSKLCFNRFLAHQLKY